MITRRVLTADSDPHMQTLVKRALAGFRLRIPGDRDGLRFTSECVSTDEEAVRRLAIDPPDIVVMEHWAPRLNSLKVLEALQKKPGDTVAVVAATRPSISAAVKATQLGAFDFLAKPLTEQRLREVLREATAQQMGYVEELGCSIHDRPHTSAQMLSRIPAALAQLATTAISLHW